MRQYPRSGALHWDVICVKGWVSCWHSCSLWR